MALLEKLLKFTPPGQTVAPMGKLFPLFLFIASLHERKILEVICYFPLSGFTFHILSQYSRIERSEENLPMRAVLRIAIFAQARLSR